MAAEELVRERIGLNPCDYRRSVTALVNIFCSAMSALVEHHRERHELQSEFPQINFDMLPSESVSVIGLLFTFRHFYWNTLGLLSRRTLYGQETGNLWRHSKTDAMRF